MLKRDEAAHGSFARAADDEPLFVLRAQDVTAPAVIRMWCEINFFNPNCAPERLKEARLLALAMEQWPNRKLPD